MWEKGFYVKKNVENKCRPSVGQSQLQVLSLLINKTQHCVVCYGKSM